MNIEFFNLVKPLEESDKGRKEKNRGNELIWVIIHIYMEMSQGNSLYSYINKEKCYFSFFSFTNMREQEGRTGPA
jgi:hypothetical protein